MARYTRGLLFIIHTVQLFVSVIQGIKG